jgi:O-antigen/teichoic acid export membrane protein
MAVQMNENPYSSRHIAVYTTFNILGKAIPMVAALVGIPIIISNLGKDLFGILAIVWVFVGYTSILDMGLPRGIIKVLSDNVSSSSEKKRNIIGTALTMMLALGVLGGLLIFALSTPLVTEWLKINPVNHLDAIHSLIVIGCAYPILVTLSGMRAILEFHQRFKVINLYNIVYGLLNYILPAIVVLISPSLILVVLTTVFVRLLNTISLYIEVRKVYENKWIPIRVNRLHVGPLFNFSKWIVSGIILSTIIGVADRFIIGALLGMVDITYFSTPLELLIKMDIIPMAVVSVLFPAFTLATANKSESVAVVYNTALKLLAFGFAVGCFFLSLIAETFLTLWLGAEFALVATPVFRLLVLSVFVIALCYVVQTLVQGVGRPELGVWAYLSLLIIGIPLTYWLIAINGIEGAALARIFRAVFELIVMFFLIGFIVKIKLHGSTLLIILSGAVALFISIYLPVNWITVLLSILSAFLLASLFWTKGLSDIERQAIFKVIPEELKQKLSR